MGEAAGRAEVTSAGAGEGVLNRPGLGLRLGWEVECGGAPPGCRWGTPAEIWTQVCLPTTRWVLPGNFGSASGERREEPMLGSAQLWLHGSAHPQATHQ